MKTFFLSLAGAFVAIILFVALVFGAISYRLNQLSERPPAPDNVVLTVDLRASLRDNPPDGGLSALGGGFSFTDLILQLRAAETDPNVEGVIIRTTTGSYGSARAEELRDAILRLQANGKFVYAHSQGSYYGGPGAFRAISAADEIWLQPGTTLNIPGLSFESVFIGDALDQLSVTPEFARREEYKTAINTFTETEHTAPEQEMLLAMAESVWTRSLEDFATDRGLDGDALRATLEAGPMSAAAAKEAGLVDELGYPENLLERAKTEAGGDEAAVVSISGYRSPPANAEAPVIALIGAEGAVISGNGANGLFDPPASFASDRLSRNLLAAGRNEQVKAIVLRIDSPGGDATAADQIWNAIRTVQTDEDMQKPVIVSMGPLAASGGYYVAAPADRIFALDSTLTGSIGVYGGKVAFADALEPYGITFDTATTGGPHADAFGADAFTPEQFAALDDGVGRIYDRFLNIVAEGRGMSENEVRAIAGGRVWTGADARARGLVDARGGLIEAIEAAKLEAGLEPDANIQVVRFPRRKSDLEILRSLTGLSVEMGPALGGVDGFVADQAELSLLLQELQRLNAARNGQVQAVSPAFIER